MNVDRALRKCTLCDVNDLGDEFHYLFRCSFFDADRKKFIDKYYYQYPNTVKFQKLMCSTDTSTIIRLAKFI